MSKGLNFESPFFRALDIIANLLVLNILAVICSVPIFTAGAAYTAMCKQIYKMKTDEDGYIVRDFFREFRVNFKQATKIWLVMLLVGGALAADIYIFMEKGFEFAAYYKLGIYALFFTLILSAIYIFPIIARYETTIKNAFKNALAMAFYAFFKSIFMVAVTVAPWVAAYFIPNVILIDLLFGLSLPAYVCAFFYSKTFADFEDRQEQAKKEKEEDEAENIEEKGE